MTESKLPPRRLGLWRDRGLRILLLILLGYVLLALAYNLATPVGEGPDEPSHFEYVHYLRARRALPVVPGAGEAPMTQAKHPPLYYLGAALVTGWADISDLGFLANPYLARQFDFDDPGSTLAHVHFEHERFPYRNARVFLAARIMRLLSLLAGLVVIGATYGLARRAWPGAPHLAWGAAAVAAFLPGFVFGGAVFNNDSLAAAWAALALWAAVRIAQGRVRARDLAAAGLVLGLGLITKLTTLAAFGVVGAACLAQAWRSRQPRFLLRAAWQVGGPVLLVAGWWLARNARLYGAADPLALRRWAARVNEAAAGEPLPGFLGTYFRIQSESFWGRFGWLTVPLPAGAYLLLDGLVLLAIVGMLLAVLRPRRPLDLDTRWALALSALAVLLFYLSVFRLGQQFGLVAVHGRYLYVVLPALALFFVTGLARLVPARREPWLMAGLALGMAGLALGSLAAVIRPAFALPQPLPAEAVAAIPARLEADFSGRLRLLGYDPAPKLPTGSPPGVTLYWAALPENRRPPFPPAEIPRTLLDLRLVDAGGRTLGSLVRPPFDGRFPPIAWLPGAVYAETFVLPARAEAGRDRSPPRAASYWYLGLRDGGGDGPEDDGQGAAGRDAGWWPVRVGEGEVSEGLRMPVEVEGNGGSPP